MIEKVAPSAIRRPSLRSADRLVLKKSLLYAANAPAVKITRAARGCGLSRHMAGILIPRPHRGRGWPTRSGGRVRVFQPARPSPPPPSRVGPPPSRPAGEGAVERGRGV